MSRSRASYPSGDGGEGGNDPGGRKRRRAGEGPDAIVQRLVGLCKRLVVCSLSCQRLQEKLNGSSFRCAFRRTKGLAVVTQRFGQVFESHCPRWCRRRTALARLPLFPLFPLYPRFLEEIPQVIRVYVRERIVRSPWRRRTSEAQTASERAGACDERTSIEVNTHRQPRGVSAEARLQRWPRRRGQTPFCWRPRTPTGGPRGPASRLSLGRARAARARRTPSRQSLVCQSRAVGRRGDWKGTRSPGG